MQNTTNMFTLSTVDYYDTDITNNLITVVKVLNTKHGRHTVVLTNGLQAVQVDGVIFTKGEERASERINVRKATQCHLCALYSNWIWEEENGGGDPAETITLV